jgi:hypothetical protein
MKELQLILFITIALIFGACGTDIKNNEREIRTYDMWRYMTPPYTVDVEYITYKLGQPTQSFIETNKIFSSFEVERVSGEDITLLTLHDNYIEMYEKEGERVEIQRFVKIGDTNIFNSNSDLNCKVDNYFFEITIKGFRFHEVIKIDCHKGNTHSEIYYANDEGIVSLYQDRDGDISETVKIREIKLQ